MFVFKKIGFICFLLFATAGWSQNRISPTMAAKGFAFEDNETQLTISVKDSVSFILTYKDKIAVLHKQPNSNCFIITARQRNIVELLKRDTNVLFVDHHRKAHVESTLEHVNMSFNRVSKAQRLFPNSAGASEKISIKEQSFDPFDIDLLNRSFSTAVTPSAISQHATTMATLIAGGGNSSAYSKGVVSKASFTSSDFNNLLPDPTNNFSSNNIFLQNHSYGVGIENYYGNEAYAYDQQVVELPSLLHVFSAGNLGTSVPLAGIYQGLNFANLSGNFKQAKNVLVVNAVDTTLTMNRLNSKGPAFDGRLKPELTAYGQGGTSDAAAVVSGISALLQEAYKGRYQQQPDASLIKAVLIASADDLGTAGIDYTYGYGSVNAYEALALIAADQAQTVGLSNNNEISLPLSIPPFTNVITIAVVWTDPAATPNSSFVLVNDVDSWLEADADIIKPWVLSSYPKTDSLREGPKRKEDHVNNVEYITLDNLTGSTYTLKLKARTLTTSSQRVSVAYRYQKSKKFNWDFPGLTDVVEGGKKNLLVWEAQSNQTGDLFLQTKDYNWTLIKSDLDLNHYFYWTTPDSLTHAKLKMKIGAEEFVTDEFLVSPRINLKTAFICSDTIGLTWTRMKGASAYQLYTMGAQYLTNISALTDTLVVRHQSTDQYFSIAPVLGNQVGLKSETINYKQQGAFCFINLFDAQRVAATQVSVQLTLSSAHQIDHIIISKTAEGKTEIFKTFFPGTGLTFNFSDNNLIPGVMTYQAEITFSNGRKILSDLAEVPIEEDGEAILYPNPVTSNSDLNILSEGGGLTLQILDVFGRILFTKELNLVEDAVDVMGLPPGIYFYQLRSNDTVTDAGRLIKL